MEHQARTIFRALLSQDCLEKPVPYAQDIQLWLKAHGGFEDCLRTSSDPEYALAQARSIMYQLVCFRVYFCQLSWTRKDECLSGCPLDSVYAWLRGSTNPLSQSVYGLDEC